MTFGSEVKEKVSQSSCLLLNFQKFGFKIRSVVLNSNDFLDFLFFQTCNKKVLSKNTVRAKNKK